MKKVNIKETKEVIHELYNSLMDRPQKPSGLLDITDVLLHSEIAREIRYC